MKKSATIALTITVAIILVAASATLAAQEVESDQDEQAAKQARSPALDCDALIAQAQEKMTQGRAMIGKSQMYRDKNMAEKGRFMYDEGKQLLETARALGPDCAAKVDKLDDKKKKKGAEKRDKLKEYY